jgi:hypothetical protein
LGGRNLIDSPPHDHISFHLCERIVGGATIDKMPDNEIAVKVRQYFQKNNSQY